MTEITSRLQGTSTRTLFAQTELHSAQIQLCLSLSFTVAFDKQTYLKFSKSHFVCLKNQKKMSKNHGPDQSQI